MTGSVDNIEVERFGALAGQWWDAKGKFRPLHQINPARLGFLREQILAHTGRDGRSAKPYARLAILDVGCGGGLISEPLARLGALVTGLDPSPETIEAARSHASAQGLVIDYIAGTTDDLVLHGRQFDCVVALEVVEHVPDPKIFLQSCASLTKPGGLLALSTLNRTAKSYALGIVAAEYMLGWLPKGTHQWRRFVTPDELRGMLAEIGLTPKAQSGISYDALRGEWRLGKDCDVNYLISAIKSA
jgi:2-polyprenyl-6-hydroxyphenyl methylase/3-demethylubiquinone-9 3-methyltransferase